MPDRDDRKNDRQLRLPERVNVNLSPLDIRLHVNWYDKDSLAALAAAIKRFFKEIVMSEVTDDLLADVQAQTTVIDSAITFINGVPAIVAEAVRVALENAGSSTAEIEAAVAQADAQIESQTQALKDALTANTPQA